MDWGDADVDATSDSSELLDDIEAISRALRLHSAPQRSLITSLDTVGQSTALSQLNPNHRASKGDTLFEQVKVSPWNWKKPLKAMTRLAHQKFNICFFLRAHSIEGLPPTFDNFSVSVHWEGPDQSLETRPSIVTDGTVNFDETLAHKCSVHGKSGALQSAKYKPKIFVIYASVIGAPEINTGRQCVDVTKLLPLTLEELKREKCNGKWSTSFMLTGYANGAVMNVSLGFSLLMDRQMESRYSSSLEKLKFVPRKSFTLDKKDDFGDDDSMVWKVDSLASTLNKTPLRSFELLEAGEDDNASPCFGLELSKSMTLLYKKFNELNLDSVNVQKKNSNCWLDAEPGKRYNAKDYDDIMFNVAQQWMKLSDKTRTETELENAVVFDESVVEVINVDEIFSEDDEDLSVITEFQSENGCHDGIKHKNELSDIGDVPNQASNVEHRQSESGNSFVRKEGCDNQEIERETNSTCTSGRTLERSLSLDDVAESVANDFINMLEEEIQSSGLTSSDDLESPRGRLLKQFEDEALNFESPRGRVLKQFEDDALKFDSPPGHVLKQFEDEVLNFESPRGLLLEQFEAEVFNFESPRERLLRQFEDEAVAFDYYLSGCDTTEEHIYMSEFGFSDASEHRVSLRHEEPSQLLTRRRAKLVENLETEALMREWGLDENVFQNSDGFGSPIELPPTEPVPLPSLGEGFGSFICIENGEGYLQSMNPSLYRISKSTCNLLIQASRPVVLPSDMGFDPLDILRHLACAPIENMSCLVNMLLPLMDLKGKTLHQIAGITARDTLSFSGVSPPPPNSGKDFNAEETDFNGEFSTNLLRHSMDHTSLEDLISLVMENISEMSIEGLRIQSGISEEPAPSSISPQPITMMRSSMSNGLLSSDCFNFDRLSELEVLSSSDTKKHIEELLKLSITLEDWLKLDSGKIGDEEYSNQRIQQVLVAHCSRSTDSAEVNSSSFDEKKGVLGNKLTIALKVQLRDPLRNYEPVGASILAILLLERNYCSHQQLPDDSTDRTGSHEKIDEYHPCFKISETLISGLRTKSEKADSWGTQAQKQSGARWLLANDISNPNSRSKQPVSNSRSVVVSHPWLMAQTDDGDHIWSLSSLPKESSRDAQRAFELPIRNPNVTFFN